MLRLQPHISHLAPFSCTEIVSVVTCDGRIIVGILRGFDQRTNVILESSHERVYSEDAPIEQIPRGLLMLRGDNVYVLFLCPT